MLRLWGPQAMTTLKDVGSLALLTPCPSRELASGRGHIVGVGYGRGSHAILELAVEAAGGNLSNLTPSGMQRLLLPSGEVALTVVAGAPGTCVPTMERFKHLRRAHLQEKWSRGSVGSSALPTASSSASSTVGALLQIQTEQGEARRVALQQAGGSVPSPEDLRSGRGVLNVMHHIQVDPLSIFLFLEPTLRQWIRERQAGVGMSCDFTR